MAISDRAATVGAHAQQLLDNQDVQAAARQAADATWAAYQRARGQGPRDAVQDRKLRRRVTAAVAAAGEFLGAVSKPPPKPKSRWPRRVALVAILATAAWLISSENARTRIRKLLGQDDSADPTRAFPVDESEVSTADERDAV